MKMSNIGPHFLCWTLPAKASHCCILDPISLSLVIGQSHMPFIKERGIEVLYKLVQSTRNTSLTHYVADIVGYLCSSSTFFAVLLSRLH